MTAAVAISWCAGRRSQLLIERFGPQRRHSCLHRLSAGTGPIVTGKASELLPCGLKGRSRAQAASSEQRIPCLAKRVGEPVLEHPEVFVDHHAEIDMLSLPDRM